MIDTPEYRVKLGDHWIEEEQPSTRELNMPVNQIGVEWVPQGKGKSTISMQFDIINEPLLAQSLAERFRNKAFGVVGIQWSLTHDGLFVVSGHSYEQVGFVTEHIRLDLRGPEAWLRLQTTWDRIIAAGLGDEPSPTMRVHGRYNWYEDFDDGVPSHFEEVRYVATYSLSETDGYLHSASATGVWLTTPYYLSDYKVTMVIGFTSTASPAYCLVRVQSKTGNNYGAVEYSKYSFYAIRINPATSTIEIARYIETIEVTLWKKEGVTIDILSGSSPTYRVQVVCVGNKLDFYFQDEYLVTIYDETYVTGGVAINLGTSSRIRLYEYYVEILRDNPTLRIPNYRDISIFHGDLPAWVETTRGNLLKISNVPRIVDYKPWMERLEDADVRVWDTADNMNDWGIGAWQVQPKKWQRVYSAEHDFKGYMVIENGVTGVVFHPKYGLMLLHATKLGRRDGPVWTFDQGGGYRVPCPRDQSKHMVFTELGPEIWRGDRISFLDAAPRRGMYGGSNAPMIDACLKTATNVESGENSAWDGHAKYYEQEVMFRDEPTFRSMTGSTEYQICAGNSYATDGMRAYARRVIPSGTRSYVANFYTSGTDYAFSYVIDEPFGRVVRLGAVITGPHAVFYVDGILRDVVSSVSDYYIPSTSHRICVGAYVEAATDHSSRLVGDVGKLRFGNRNKGKTVPKLYSTSSWLVCWVRFDQEDWDLTNGRFKDQVGSYHLQMDANNVGVIASDGWYNEWLKQPDDATYYSMGYIDGLDATFGGEPWSVGVTILLSDTPADREYIFGFSPDGWVSDYLILDVDSTLTLRFHVHPPFDTAVSITTTITTGVVYRVLAVMDANLVMKLYVNGTLVGSASIGDVNGIGDANFYVGGSGINATRTWDGYIDELMIYDKEMTPETDGVVLLDQFDMGVPYLKSEFRLVDGEWRQKNQRNYKRPIIWIRAYEQSNWGTMRSSGIGFNGTAGYRAPTAIGNGFMFGTTAELVSEPYWKFSEEYELAEFTMQYYFRTTNMAQQYHIRPYDYGGISWHTMFVRQLSTSQIEVRIYDGDAAAPTSNYRNWTTPASSIAIDTLYHVAVRFKSGTLSIMLNGVEQTLTETTTGSAPSKLANNDRIYIMDTANVGFQGWLGEVCIHDYWLKDEELGWFVDTDEGFRPASAILPSLTSLWSYYTKPMDDAQIVEIRPEQGVVQSWREDDQKRIELSVRADCGGIGIRLLERDTSATIYIQAGTQYYLLQNKDVLGFQAAKHRFKIAIENEYNVRLTDLWRDYGSNNYAYKTDVKLAREPIAVIAFGPFTPIVWVFLLTEPDQTATAFDYSMATQTQYPAGGTSSLAQLCFAERMAKGDHAYYGAIPVPYHTQMVFDIGDATSGGAAIFTTNVLHSGANAFVTCAHLSASSIQWEVTLERGSYVAIVVHSADSTTKLQVLDGSVVLVEETIAPTAAWTYVSGFFTVENERADVTIKYEETDGTDAYADYMVCVPLMNGYNYPLDAVHQFHTKTRVERKLLTDGAR